MSIKPVVIAIVGPTATGKSDCAVSIAKFIEKNGKKMGVAGAEIISADSRQVYKKMDIGTGKITKREMRGIPHHLLDIISPKKSMYSVADYQKKAKRAAEAIFRKNKIAIVCGGTGFYIDALVDGLLIPNVPPNPALRKNLSTKSVNDLYAILIKKDPTRARAIDKKNPVRLIRAIEIASALGMVPPLRKNPLDADIIFVGIYPGNKILRERIHARLLKRIQAGMIREIETLKKSGVSWKKFEALGLEYRYIARYLRGRMEKTRALDALEREIFAYAKRQMTWFKKNKNVLWAQNGKDAERIVVEKLLRICKERRS